MYDEKIHFSKGVKKMHKKIIAGVMSTLICATALTPDAGVLATQYSPDKTGTVENEKIEGSTLSDDLSLYDQAESQKAADGAANTEVSETPVETIGAENENTAETVTENTSQLIAAVPADEDIIETVVIGENITGYIYSNGLLRIHGYGAMSDYAISPFRNASSVTQILFENEDAENGKTITGIGSNIFYAFENLSSSSCDDIAKAESGIVMIPDSVKSIGSRAFGRCTSVKEFRLNNGLDKIDDNAFSECTGLKTLTVPDSVTVIGLNILYGCKGLETLKIPYASTAKSISDGEEDVNGYTSVYDFFLQHGHKENNSELLKDYSLSRIIITGGGQIPDYAFSGMSSVKEIDLSETSVKSIGNYAFYNCSSLENVILNDSIESVGNYAYANTIIKTLPDNSKIKTVGDHAFEGCKKLNIKVLPESYQSFGSYAFKDCTGITELVVPENITSMGVAAFNGCTEIKSLTLPFAATQNESAELNGTVDGYCSVSDLFFQHGHMENNGTQFEGYSVSEIIITGGDKIPDYAFAGIPTLKTVDFSKTRTIIIGQYAFLNCTSLENVLMPDTVTTIREGAFKNCTSLTDIKYSKKLESIENEAFLNCTGFSKFSVPSTVTSMGVNMLQGCTNIESLELPYAATLKTCSYKDGSIDGYSSVYDLFWSHGHAENNPELLADYSVSKITITGGEIIPDFAFAGMGTLKEIDLSKAKTASIGKNAFYNCNNLNNVILNDSIESVGNYAYARTAIKALPDNKKIKDLGEHVFEGCTGLKDITIPESYQKFGEYAFKDCTGITELTIPETVRTLGIGMFNGCTQLKTLTLPYAATASVIADKDGQPDGYSSVSDLFFVHGHAQNNINQFTDYAFSKLIINGGEKIPNFAFAGIPVKEIDISGTKVEEIGEYAFLNCAGVENIALPDSVKTIRNNAFENCTGLAAIELNDGLESIGTETFKNCTGLNSLTVPDTVTSMGTNMLNGCFNLEELTIPYAATQKSCTDAEGVINGYSSVSDLFVIHGHLENNNSSLAGYPVSRITVTGGEKIPAFAFSGFSSLKEIDLSHTNAESVGDSAFYNCSSAKNIILPETVTSVDKNAFANANADIYIYNPECTVSEKAFSDDYSGTIHGLTESAVKTLSDSKEYKFDALDDEIIIGPVNLTLKVGETYKINSNKKDLQFTSSDPEIVNVSKDGILKAEKEGKASVEVKADKDQSSSMNIWVRNPYVTETPAVTEPVVTTAESVTTSVSETEPAAVTTTEAVTTTVLETEATTITTVTSTEPVTTTASETTVTTVTSTEPYGTDVTDIKDPTDLIPFNIASLEEFSEWAKKDYSIRTGKEAAEAVVIPVTAKYYKIEIKDENGNILDTYSINPKIGIGTTSDNEVVNLPQTGNNSRKNLFTAFAALLMTIIGAAAMKFSGIFDRRRRNSK